MGGVSFSGSGETNAALKHGVDDMASVMIFKRGLCPIRVRFVGVAHEKLCACLGVERSVVEWHRQCTVFVFVYRLRYRATWQSCLLCDVFVGVGDGTCGGVYIELVNRRELWLMPELIVHDITSLPLGTPPFRWFSI